MDIKQALKCNGTPAGKRHEIEKSAIVSREQKIFSIKTLTLRHKYLRL